MSSSGAPTPAPAPEAAPQAPSAPATKKTKPSKSRAKTATKATGAAGTAAKVKKPVRRKKPPTSKSSGGASATQVVLSTARSAQLDLAKQKAEAAARRSDPLWYRMEDVLPAVRDASPMTSANSSVLSEQVQIVEAALVQNGLTRTDVTPQAMACLLEQARRYAHELIVNAQDYALAANRPGGLMRADLMLAAELRADHPLAVSTQLPKLNLMAQQVNRAPLPPIPVQCYTGVLLPPVPHQLTARTYDIVSGAHVTQKMVRAVPEAPSLSTTHQTTKKASPSSSSKSQPASYGANRGRQIPIKLKEQPRTTTVSTTTTTTTTGSPNKLDPSASTTTATPMDTSPTTGGGATATGAPPSGTSVPTGGPSTTTDTAPGNDVPPSTGDAPLLTGGTSESTANN